MTSETIAARIFVLAIVSIGIGLLARSWKGRSPITWAIIPFLAGLIATGLSLATVIILACLKDTRKAPDAQPADSADKPTESA